MTKLVLLALVAVACVSASYRAPVNTHYAKPQHHYQAPVPVYHAPKPVQQHYYSKYIPLQQPYYTLHSERLASKKFGYLACDR